MAGKNGRVRSDFTWRYISRGKAKHALALRSSAATGHASIAECGSSPAWFDPWSWMGTGSQDEYDRIEELPECARCVILVGPAEEPQK